MTAKIFTDEGWSDAYAQTVIEDVFKMCAAQLLNLRESIDAVNPKVLQAPTVQRTMRHVELFEQEGFNHQGPGGDTRKVRGQFKISFVQNLNTVKNP
jgi:hypothetical protein